MLAASRYCMLQVETALNDNTGYQDCLTLHEVEVVDQLCCVVVGCVNHARSLQTVFCFPARRLFDAIYKPRSIQLKGWTFKWYPSVFSVIR